MSIKEFRNKPGNICKQEFLVSSEFTMPANVLDNEILVTTTGGGGAGFLFKHSSHNRSDHVVGRGGGGSGICYSLLNMREGETAKVTVGAGVNSAFTIRNKYPATLSSSPGGSSSFTGAQTCPGGEGVT